MFSPTEIPISWGVSAVMQSLAVLVQITAAVFAWRLTKVSGGRVSWYAISGALVIMALRRSFSLYRLVTHDPLGMPDFLDNSVAVGISLFMLVGVVSIAPLFETIKAAAETLRQSRDELEVKVSERTNALREANVRLNTELEERKIAQRELARSNAELEQFAYVASHDLQEPLRMVASFTQLLAKRYRTKLDADADEFIGFAVDGARRMQLLLNDLLAYSRVGTRGKLFEPTDCNEVLQEALANLTTAIEESDAAVNAGPLPKVAGDEVQLLQLFQNLISNALKFHNPGQPPQIRISAQREGSNWVFTVRDNGIGIAPEHQDRIFLIFQRLHQRHEYPGTGIGLALCKKIIERHGGRLWVESAPGQGATFYFTIPATPGNRPAPATL
jgi:light-regulated signal transduction histidine kinase (bacteriophytochrome)